MREITNTPIPILRGFSETSLKKMRLFYEQWQCFDSGSIETPKELNSCVATDKLQISENQTDIYHSITIPNTAKFPIEDFFQLPFSHHVEVFSKVKDLSARYYISRAAKERLSVDTLEQLIKQNAFEHQGNLPNNFAQTISNSTMACKAVMMFKDSYALQFINTEEIGERDCQDVDEQVVEQKIVQNIKKFIMTFGEDFTFVGNQYHLEVYGEEFFPDLIFFNRALNSLVVVELKTGEFKNSYLGQLTDYLQILDDKVRKPHENPSIGIVLCTSANKAYVEYVIKAFDKPMGVATYTTAADMPENLRKALPNQDDLIKLMGDE